MTTTSIPPEPHWYCDRASLNFIAFRYVPLLGTLNLLWEIAQLPFYTLWEEGPPSFIAYAVVHCTLGDVVIGTLALLIALIATRACAVATWKWRQVALFLVVPAVGYTALSEWINTIARGSWAYSALMPIVNLGGFEVGLAPLLQWLILPPAALWLARFHSARRLGIRSSPEAVITWNPSMATPYDDVILDHIKNARNYRVPESVGREIRGSNVLCGDELVLFLRMDGGCIVDIGFQCSCCGLSMASASVMTETVKGKGTGDAELLLREFTGRLGGTLHSDCAALGREQQALLDAAQRFPARARCVALPWTTLMSALAETE